jgi:hypothetical protein
MQLNELHHGLLQSQGKFRLKTHHAVFAFDDLFRTRLHQKLSYRTPVLHKNRTPSRKLVSGKSCKTPFKTAALAAFQRSQTQGAGDHYQVPCKRQEMEFKTTDFHRALLRRLSMRQACGKTVQRQGMGWGGINHPQLMRPANQWAIVPMF